MSFLHPPDEPRRLRLRRLRRDDRHRERHDRGRHVPARSLVQNAVYHAQSERAAEMRDSHKRLGGLFELLDGIDAGHITLTPLALQWLCGQRDDARAEIERKRRSLERAKTGDREYFPCGEPTQEGAVREIESYTAVLHADLAAVEAVLAEAM